MSDLGDFYWGIPRVTRGWFTGSIVFPLLGRFGIINPLTLILLYERLQHFEIWRLLTCILYYPINPSTGFHYLINLYFLYNYGRRLEEGVFAGRPADFAYLLIFNWISCVVIGLAADMPLLMDPMILSVLYVWCQLNKDVTVTFWFGTRFKAVFLPWVLLAFNLIINQGGVLELVGILVGHLYFFLAFKYPQELGGTALLQTPGFLKSWLPDETDNVHGFGTTPQRAEGPPGGPGLFRRGNWGHGHVLGGN